MRLENLGDGVLAFVAVHPAFGGLQAGKLLGQAMRFHAVGQRHQNLEGAGMAVVLGFGGIGLRLDVLLHGPVLPRDKPACISP